MKVHRGTQVRLAERFIDFKSLLEHGEMHYKDMPAFMFRRSPSEEVLTRTYGAFAVDVRALAEYFISLTPDKPKSHIAFVGKNSYEWLMIHMAILCSGRISVPMDNQLPSNELLNLLAKGDVDIFISNLRHYKSGMEALETYPSLKTFIVNDFVGKNDKLPTLPEAPVGKALGFFSQALEEGHRLREEGKREFEKVRLNPSEMAAIFFTSGTTSQAKGVMLSQDNILYNVQAINQTVYIEAGERFLSVLPAHHTLEHTVSLIYPQSIGGTICFSDGLRYIGQNMKEWEISAMVAVPALVESMWRLLRKRIKSPALMHLVNGAIALVGRLGKIFGMKARRKIFSAILKEMGGKIHIMVVGAAPTDPKVIRAFNAIGITLYQGYGLTEHSPVVSSCSEIAHVVGSVGPPLPGVEVAIQEDEALEEGQGEVVVKSHSVMLGYYKEPELTRETIDDKGWLHTGDMGYFDRKGCLHITGRYKSVIVLENGKNVFPEEVEALFNDYPGVTATMIWGDTNPRGHVDLICRFELDEKELPQELQESDEAISTYLDKLVRKVNGQMPNYKAIRYFVFSDQKIIRNTTMKVKRHDELSNIHETLGQEKTFKDVDKTRIF